MSVFAKRLKEARRACGLSQEKLGVLAGIEEESASSRMNHYEKGRHEPDFSMVERLAKVLEVPEAFFYAKDDDVAWILSRFQRLKKSQRMSVVKHLAEILNEPLP